MKLKLPTKADNNSGCCSDEIPSEELTPNEIHKGKTGLRVKGQVTLQGKRNNKVIIIPEDRYTYTATGSGLTGQEDQIEFYVSTTSTEMSSTIKSLFGDIIRSLVSHSVPKNRSLEVEAEDILTNDDKTIEESTINGIRDWPSLSIPQTKTSKPHQVGNLKSKFFKFTTCFGTNKSDRKLHTIDQDDEIIVEDNVDELFNEDEEFIVTSEIDGLHTVIIHSEKIFDNRGDKNCADQTTSSKKTLGNVPKTNKNGNNIYETICTPSRNIERVHVCRDHNINHLRCYTNCQMIYSNFLYFPPTTSKFKNPCTTTTTSSKNCRSLCNPDKVKKRICNGENLDKSLYKSIEYEMKQPSSSKCLPENDTAKSTCKKSEIVSQQSIVCNNPPYSTNMTTIIETITTTKDVKPLSTIVNKETSIQTQKCCSEPSITPHMAQVRCTQKDYSHIPNVCRNDTSKIKCKSTKESMSKLCKNVNVESRTTIELSDKSISCHRLSEMEKIPSKCVETCPDILEKASQFTSNYTPTMVKPSLVSLAKNNCKSGQIQSIAPIKVVEQINVDICITDGQQRFCEEKNESMCKSSIHLSHSFSSVNNDKIDGEICYAKTPNVSRALSFVTSVELFFHSGSSKGSFSTKNTSHEISEIMPELSDHNSGVVINTEIKCDAYKSEINFQTNDVTINRPCDIISQRTNSILVENSIKIDKVNPSSAVLKNDIFRNQIQEAKELCCNNENDITDFNTVIETSINQGSMTIVSKIYTGQNVTNNKFAKESTLCADTKKDCTDKNRIKEVSALVFPTRSSNSLNERSQRNTDGNSDIQRVTFAESSNQKTSECKKKQEKLDTTDYGYVPEIIRNTVKCGEYVTTNVEELQMNSLNCQKQATVIINDVNGHDNKSVKKIISLKMSSEIISNGQEKCRLQEPINISQKNKNSPVVHTSMKSHCKEPSRTCATDDIVLRNLEDRAIPKFRDTCCPKNRNVQCVTNEQNMCKDKGSVNKDCSKQKISSKNQFCRDKSSTIPQNKTSHSGLVNSTNDKLSDYSGNYMTIDRPIPSTKDQLLSVRNTTTQVPDIQSVDVIFDDLPSKRTLYNIPSLNYSVNKDNVPNNTVNNQDFTTIPDVSLNQSINYRDKNMDNESSRKGLDDVTTNQKSTIPNASFNKEQDKEKYMSLKQLTRDFESNLVKESSLKGQDMTLDEVSPSEKKSKNQYSKNNISELTSETYKMNIGFYQNYRIHSKVINKREYKGFNHKKISKLFIQFRRMIKPRCRIIEALNEDDTKKSDNADVSDFSIHGNDRFAIFDDQRNIINSMLDFHNLNFTANNCLNNTNQRINNYCCPLPVTGDLVMSKDYNRGCCDCGYLICCPSKSINPCVSYKTFRPGILIPCSNGKHYDCFRKRERLPRLSYAAINRCTANPIIENKISNLGKFTSLTSKSPSKQSFSKTITQITKNVTASNLTEATTNYFTANDTIVNDHDIEEIIENKVTELPGKMISSLFLGTSMSRQTTNYYTANSPSNGASLTSTSKIHDNKPSFQFTSGTNDISRLTTNYYSANAPSNSTLSQYGLLNDKSKSDDKITVSKLAKQSTDIISMMTTAYYTALTPSNETLDEYIELNKKSFKDESDM